MYAIYVKGVETRDKHIFAHNFLDIQLIFNPQKKDLGLSNQILCMLT